MKEQDVRAVESMCRCGMELEGVVSLFPKFPPAEIEKIYNRIHGVVIRDNKSKISINCS